MALIKGFHRRRRDTWGKKMAGKIVIVPVGKVDSRILEDLLHSIGKIFRGEKTVFFIGHPSQTQGSRQGNRRSGSGGGRL
jgi:hypothetical protein